MVMAVDLPTKGAVSVFYFTHYNVSFYFEATAIFSLSMGASRWGQKGPECPLLVKEGGEGYYIVWPQFCFEKLLSKHIGHMLDSVANNG